MQRIRLDTANEAVKKLLRSLPVDRNGIELELDGALLCKIVPAAQLSDAEKQALIEERWRLIRRARERSKHVPACVLEREVDEAIDEVRRQTG
jgi:hypothetical protein